MKLLNHKFVPVIKYTYEMIFHENMGNEALNFLKNVYYVGVGTIIATIFSFTFSILSGRILGPAEYGKFSLVESVAMFLYIPMLMGYNNAMVKYNAEKNDLNRQRNIISTTYILVFSLTIISTVVYLLVPLNILKMFSVSKDMFNISIFYAVFFVFFTLTKDTFKGLWEMKKYSIFAPINSFILLICFLYLISIKFISYKSVVFSFLITYGITGMIILISLKKYLKVEVNLPWACKLTKYGAYTLIGSISFIFYSNIDQLLINVYMDSSDLGIYKAYYFASINVASIIFGIINSVFFPFASKCNDKKVIFKKIDEITPYLFGFGIPSIFFLEIVILNLYGKEYPINLPLAIAFSIVSILIVYYGIHDWTFCSEGIKGVKLVNKSTILIALINILLDVYLIPLFGLLGAMMATAVAFITGIYFLVKRRNNYEL